jgi:RNA polymerase sigma factor (sigma-70 family)
MSGADSTRWSLIRKAAAGLPPAREDFAAVYEPAARAYFAARWRDAPLRSEIDDAVQETFLACFREGGALSRADSSRPGGFRAYFYGILRKVALSFERKGAQRRDRYPPPAPGLEELPADDPGLSSVFDQAWASALVREAVQLYRERCEERGPGGRLRFEVLRLRFEEGLPVREIAARTGEEATRLYGVVKKAKQEFEEALFEVVRYHHPASEEEVISECRRVASMLG